MICAQSEKNARGTPRAFFVMWVSRSQPRQGANLKEMTRTTHKKALAGAALVLLLLIGLGLTLYPALSNYLASGEQSAVQAQYTDEVKDMTNEKISTELEAAQLYNEALLSVQSAETVELRSYDDLLNLAGNGVMGYVEIPIIGVILPIYHGVSEEVLAKGAGHMPGTSLPIGGESTHAVISAHAGLPSARLFTDLDTLQVGDLFYIYVLDEALCYEVDQIIVTLPSDTEAVQIEEGEDYVTLLTCTPYGINTHRLLVRGRRTESLETVLTAEDKSEQPERSSTWIDKYLQGIVTGVSGSGLLIGVLVLIWKIRKNRN